MFERILVALDGSDTAAAALPLVRLVAKKVGSEVIVLRVHDTRARTEYPELGEPEDSGRQEAQDYAAEVASSFRSDSIVATPVAVAGAPAEAIVSFSEKARPSAIAMATHGRTGLSRWALGSVAEKVLRTSERPMFLVRAVPRPEELPLTLRQVVVAIDGSARSLRIVPWVVAIAHAFGAAVRVVHFVSDYVGKEAMPLGERYLEEAREAFGGHGLAVDLDLRRGDPGSGLSDYGLFDAGREPPNLLAMTTHGRSGLPRMLLGSVAEKVLRATTTPMLVVPAAD